MWLAGWLIVSAKKRKPYVFHIAKSAFYAFVCGIRMVVCGSVMCTRGAPLTLTGSPTDERAKFRLPSASSQLALIVV
jgi:hypothetical protein